MDPGIAAEDRLLVVAPDVLAVGFMSYNAMANEESALAPHPCPGDIILRVGSAGSSLSIDAPFAGVDTCKRGGLRQVVNELQRRLQSGQDWVELLLTRGSSTIATLVPTSRFAKKKTHSFFNVRDPGLLLECHLKEAKMEDFAEIKAHQEIEMRATVARSLDSLDIGDQEMEDTPGNISTVVSVMVYPSKDTNGFYHGVSQTGALALNWLSRAQTAGVALDLISLSSEVVPISRRWSGATPVQKLLHHCQDSKWFAGDVGSIRCYRGVRLWLRPQDEVQFTLCAVSPHPTNWRMHINKSEQGFLYVGSVDEEGEAAKCGLDELLRISSQEGKLVIRAINGKDVIPKMLCNGKIVTASIQDIHSMLILHLQHRRPVTFDFIVSEKIGQAARQVQQMGLPILAVQTAMV